MSESETTRGDETPDAAATRIVFEYGENLADQRKTELHRSISRAIALWGNLISAVAEMRL